MKRVTKKNEVSGKYERAETALPFQVLQRLGEYEDAGMTPQQVERMRWISVDERLPPMIEGCDFSDRIITAVERGRVCIMCYHESDGTFTVGGVVPHEKVTHWMPMPAPPEEKIK